MARESEIIFYQSDEGSIKGHLSGRNILDDPNENR